MNKRKLYYLFYRTSYPLSDFVVISFSIIFSYHFYVFMNIGQRVIYKKSFYVPLSIGASLLIVLIMSFMGVYSKKSSILNVFEIRNTVKGIVFSYLFFSVLLVFSKTMISRYFIFISFIFCILSVVGFKMFIYNKFFSLIPMLSICKKSLIYGAGGAGQMVFRELVSSPRLLSLPVGFVDDDPAMKGKIFYQGGYNKSVGLEVLSDWKDVTHIIEKHGVSELYLALPSLNYVNIRGILDSIEKYNLSIYLIPELYDIMGNHGEEANLRYLKLERDQVYGNLKYFKYKRCLDLILAVLLLVLLPFYLIIGLIIKIDSRGSVLFHHDRVGRGGKLFRMYKFRTMKVETERYELSPLRQDDPRITRFGRFLRKTSLDEIPQIINVLKGEMSFVGPRPEMPFIVEKYEAIHNQRLQVLPGITGLWQLSADRRLPIHRNIYYDLYYINNASFFMDIAILLNTMLFPFKGI